jgi:hypothetical protein
MRIVIEESSFSVVEVKTGKIHFCVQDQGLACELACMLEGELS